MKRCLHDRNHRGHTLLELIVSTAIMSVIVIGAMAVFVASARVQRDVYQNNTVDAEARELIDYLTSDIRTAMEIKGTVTVAGTTYTSSPTTLILQLPCIDGAGLALNPEDTAPSFDYVIYTVTTGSNPVMMRIVEPASGISSRNGADRIIGRSIFPSITVDGTYQAKPNALGAYQVHYEFTAGRSIAGQIFKEPIAGTIRLRNKL